MTEEQNSLGIVVASCDNFSDMWEPLFALFFKYWPDCPYPVYLVANHKKFTHDRVTMLLAGEDLSWSTTMSRAVSQLTHSHILFWIDDAFPIARVDSEKINELYQWMLSHKANFLRLRPNPKPKKWLPEDIGILSCDASYRTTIFATIWRLEIFNQILKKDESAWDFELIGTERSRGIDGFYCTKNNVFKYLHGVIKGVWVRTSALKLQKMGYKIDFRIRPVMSKKHYYLRVKLMSIKGFVYYLIPESQRDNALKIVRKCYKSLGLR